MPLAPSLHSILHHLGLQEVMDEIPREGFQVYAPPDYEGSERQSMDDVYRMRELVLLHRSSGLRLEYLASESYYGDEVRYRFRSVFVITMTDAKLEVTAADFENKMLATPERNIRFDEVRRDV
jgi:hypothetical protein